MPRLLLAIVGGVCLLAAGLAPALMWPQEQVASQSTKLAALTIGGVLLAAGAACWVGAAARRR